MVIKEQGKKGWKGMGRRAIEIKYIENKNARHVTFSKRRLGLYRKVFDLCIDGGAECAAVLTFSEAGKPFPFLYPHTDSVLQRFIQTQDPNNQQASSSSSQPTGRVHDPLMEEYYGLVKELEAEEALSFALNQRTPKFGSGSGSRSGFWWEADMTRMGQQELKRWAIALETLREMVARRAFEVQASVNPIGEGSTHMAQVCCSPVEHSSPLEVPEDSSEVGSGAVEVGGSFEYEEEEEEKRWGVAAEEVPAWWCWSDCTPPTC
ncbi:agamous-like MADS-box protein AGL61 [Amborella trichopoda]|nr:agamous-like MADS-box protein AGL61 [Amborella trichopoda]|eukprot:XP_006851363.2 agamous-like MADS-box protein AGL61 [Amborella trichopoda]